MLRNIILLIICISSIDGKINISEIMIDQKIVPDIINNSPQELLQVIFPHGEIKPGEVLTLRQCFKAPKLNWTHETDAYYTIMMIGVTPWNQETHVRRPYLPYLEFADSTHEPPKFRKSLHWLVVNIPGNDVENGETKQAYHPSIHVLESTKRFVLVVFKENGKCNFDETHPKLLQDRNITNSNKIYINTITYLLDYFFENENPLAGNYFDRDINIKEDSQFNSADYEMMKNLGKFPTQPKNQDEDESATIITLLPVV